MISVIFHDIFSRFPKGTEKTEDEGKVLSYEEFELTSEYLKKNNIDSFSENLPDDLKNRGVYCSSKYDKVIVISRSIVVEQMLWGLVYSNVYYYGGLAMSKNIILDFLKRKGFNVPDFVGSMPIIALNKVVLPAPFLPIKPTIWPFSKSKDTSLRISINPIFTFILLIFNIIKKS